jgi:transposase
MDQTKIEYETVQIGGALLVRGLLKELGVVNAIDSALSAQPEINATYGHLMQAIIVNRLSLDPQPLYRIGEWTAQHGIDHLFGIEAAWLDDDRLGAGLEAIADHQVEIWISILKRARQRFKLPFEEFHGDTTSIYFEGNFEAAQAAAPKQESPPERVPHLCLGYNKDGQRDKKQLVLSLLSVGRVPVWYCPWDGNRSDDGVCWSDLKELSKQVLVPENSLLIGDRKLCSQETMLECCRAKQRFLAPHPWTPTAKDAWLETHAKIESGQLRWRKLDYVAQNDARKAPENRPRHQVCEVTQELKDKAFKTSYDLRWLFIHSSTLAATAQRQRDKALKEGAAALDRLGKLMGKYQYRTREFITRRLKEELRRTKSADYFKHTLTGTDGERDWQLTWERNEEAIKKAASFDGVSLLCTNAPSKDLPANDALRKYKEQIGVEQAIDFIKSPVQIRPTWLHLPKRIAGLTLLIMIAVLVAMLLEFEVRRLLKEQNKKIEGLRPEGRKDPAPTAKSLLRAFSDYSLVVVKQIDGTQETHYPKFKPVQQQIWDLLGLPPVPG